MQKPIPQASMSPDITVEGDSEEESLTSHEVWIAIQEGRVPRPDIMRALSASRAPPSSVPGTTYGTSRHTCFLS